MLNQVHFILTVLLFYQIDAPLKTFQQRAGVNLLAYLALGMIKSNWHLMFARLACRIISTGPHLGDYVHRLCALSTDYSILLYTELRQPMDNWVWSHTPLESKTWFISIHKIEGINV